jgi:hypothetical protein
MLGALKDPAAETAGRQRQKENSQFSWQAFRLNDATYIGSCGKDRRVYHLLTWLTPQSSASQIKARFEKKYTTGQ